MGRRKKSVSDHSSPVESDYYANMENDIHAIRGKNKQLVQTVAKLQQDKSLLQKQITSLQEEFFKLNSKYCNLKNIFVTIDTTTKSGFPKMVEVVNSMTKVMNLCSVGSAVSRINKDPQTLTVKPHIVNGTVINNPTITLSRFNGSESSGSPNATNNNPDVSPQSPTSNINNTPLRRSRNDSILLDNRPSTSREIDEREMEDEPVDYVSRYPRRLRQNLEEDQNDTSLELSPDEDENQEENSDPDYCQRLVTIEEEESAEYDNRTSTSFSDRVREIRIYLSPLPTDRIDPEITIVGRSSSLSGEVSNSIIDPNNSLLNDSHGSPTRTIRFMDSSNENTTVKSPNKSNKSERFSDTDLSWNKKVKVKKLSSTLNESPCSFMENISAIQHPNSFEEADENANASYSLEKSKIYTMQSLGLSPKNRQQLATSTPVPTTPRTSTRISQRRTKSLEKSASVVSNITKRKNGLSDDKLAQVIIHRLSLNKTRSPINKVTDVLNTSPITSAMEIKTKKRSRENGASEAESKIKTATKHENLRKKKGKENRKQPLSLSQSIQSSPRPKRSARPSILKEKSLKKKMRRSR